MLTLYPKKSFVKNIGFDSDATHNNNFFYYNTKFDLDYKKPKLLNIVENSLAKDKIKSFFVKQRYLRAFKFLKYKITNILRLFF